MHSTRRVISAIIFALFVGAFISGTAWAAEPEQKFGTVDLEKAFDSYKKKVDLENQLSGEFGQVKQWFELRADNKLLSDEEFNQLNTLKGKAQPNDEEKKKIDELLAVSKQKEQDFTSLQQKTSATEEEKTRLKDLQAQINKVDAVLRDEGKKKEEELTKKRVELSQQVMKDVEAMVTTVAKEKGLSMVFNKSFGEPGLVIYSNLDITEDVIKRLNK